MARPQPTVTPVKTAFAGSTFNASPAPSALPLPKLLSRSVPANAGQRSLQARLRHEQDQQPQDDVPRASSPPSDGPPTDGAIPAQAASPLDIFFRADQEEKAGDRRALKAAPSPSQRHSFGPGRLPENPLTVTPSPTQRHRRQPTDNGTTDMFSFEMDGDTPTKTPPIYPLASSTPPRPAEVVRSNTTPGTTELGRLEAEERLRQQSEILKALLRRGPQSPMDNQTSPKTSDPQPESQHEPSADRVGPPIFGPSPAAKPHRTQSTPTRPPTGPRNNRNERNPQSPGSPTPSPNRRYSGNNSPRGNHHPNPRHRRQNSNPNQSNSGRPPSRPSHLRQEIKPLSPTSVDAASPTRKPSSAPPRPPDKRGSRGPSNPDGVNDLGNVRGGEPEHDLSSPSPKPPVTPIPSTEIRDMEADLRRILNIGVRTASSDSGNGIVGAS